ncbi:MAG: hypothetical protein KKB39_05435 [Nanoarchaeota archaeon]|nr:hypothetical protein [Nanoarchaeota archaeon]
MKKIIAALGLVALVGCATIQPLKFTQSIDTDSKIYNITRIDKNNDGIFEGLIMEERDKTTNKMIIKKSFLDINKDNNIDIVLSDFQNVAKYPYPDGEYDISNDYDDYFQKKFSRTPLLEEKKVDWLFNKIKEELK